MHKHKKMKDCPESERTKTKNANQINSQKYNGISMSNCQC